MKTKSVRLQLSDLPPSYLDPAMCLAQHQIDMGEMKEMSLQEIIESHPRKQKMPAWLSTLQCLADGPVLPRHTTVDKTEIGLLRGSRLAFQERKDTTKKLS